MSRKWFPYVLWLVWNRSPRAHHAAVVAQEMGSNLAQGESDVSASRMGPIPPQDILPGHESARLPNRPLRLSSSSQSDILSFLSASPAGNGRLCVAELRDFYSHFLGVPPGEAHSLARKAYLAMTGVSLLTELHFQRFWNDIPFCSCLWSWQVLTMAELLFISKTAIDG